MDNYTILLNKTQLVVDNLVNRDPEITVGDIINYLERTKSLPGATEYITEESVILKMISTAKGEEPELPNEPSLEDIEEERKQKYGKKLAEIGTMLRMKPAERAVFLARKKAAAEKRALEAEEVVEEEVQEVQELDPVVKKIVSEQRYFSVTIIEDEEEENYKSRED